jgi:hypothetical protein
MRALLPVLAAIALIPAPAFAVTVQELVMLSKAGVSDEVLLALIERDDTILPLDSEQLMRLKREGISDTIVLAMLRSGRREPAPPAAATDRAVPIREPIVVVVGHGPDVPNTYHPFDYTRVFPTWSLPYLPVFGSGVIVGPCPAVVSHRPIETTTSSLERASQNFVNSTWPSPLPRAGTSGGCGLPAARQIRRRH